MAASDRNEFSSIVDIDFSTMTYSDPKTQSWKDERTGEQKTSFPMCYAQKSKTDPVEIWFQSCEPDQALINPSATTEQFNAAKLGLLCCESAIHLIDPAKAKYPSTDGKHLVQFSVPDDQVHKYTQIDTINRSYIEQNAEKLFKQSHMPPTMLAMAYKPLYAQDNKTGKMLLRVKISESTTFFVHAGADEFRLADMTHLRIGCRCVVAMRYKGMYFQQTQSGATLEASQVYIWPSDSLGKTGRISFGGQRIRIAADPIDSPALPNGGSDDDESCGGGGGSTSYSQYTEKTVLGLPTNMVVQTPPLF